MKNLTNQYGKLISQNKFEFFILFLLSIFYFLYDINFLNIFLIISSSEVLIYLIDFVGLYILIYILKKTLNVNKAWALHLGDFKSLTLFFIYFLIAFILSDLSTDIINNLDNEPILNRNLSQFIENTLFFLFMYIGFQFIILYLVNLHVKDKYTFSEIIKKNNSLIYLLILPNIFTVALAFIADKINEPQNVFLLLPQHVLQFFYFISIVTVYKITIREEK